MMTNYPSLLLSLLLASASADTSIPSIRRFLENTAPFLIPSSAGGGEAFGDVDIDMACMMAMAVDEDSCVAAVDSNGVNCVWCSLGGDLGGCVSSDIADTINEGGIPHLQCGVQLSAEDETFFDDLKSCVVKGDTAAACLGPSVTADGTPCSWCVTAMEPYFGTCFSEAFVSEIKDLDEMDMMSAVMDCSPQASQDVGAIADMHCITDGNPPDAFDPEALNAVCLQTKDALGQPCVVTSLYGMMDVCVTETQRTVFDYSMDQMNAVGVSNPMSLFTGGSGISMGASGFADVEDEFEEEPDESGQ